MRGLSAEVFMSCGNSRPDSLNVAQLSSKCCLFDKNTPFKHGICGYSQALS